MSSGYQESIASIQEQVYQPVAELVLMSDPDLLTAQQVSQGFRFICCFTSRSTARVILRRVVLQVEETSAYCTVNHRASASNYQLSNMKCPARDLNRWPQRLEARTLTTTPPSPPVSQG